jgi:hypothetical protein
MKYLIYLFAVIIVCSCHPGFKKAKHIASKVDSLNTESQIEDLVHSLDSFYRYFKLQKLENLKTRDNFEEDIKIRKIAKKYNITKSFYKEDLDNNGYTDLILIGDHHFCKDAPTCQFTSIAIMNFGNDSLAILDIVKQRHTYIAPQVKQDKNGPYLIIHSNKEPYSGKPGLTISHQRLVSVFGSFIEYNPKPANIEIEKIQFASSLCYGVCPAFELSIDNDGSAVFIAKYYNFTKEDDGSGGEEGVFKTKIKDDDLKKLMGLINYSDFRSLKDQYSVSWTDDKTGKLIITYANGKTKTIEDYGECGTYGLISIYKELYALRFNQKWQKAKEPKGMRILPF